MAADEHIGPDARRCIDECLRCSATCTEAIAHAVAIGGVYMDPERIRDLMDCAALCRTSADLILRASGLHRDVCAVTADACDFCAESSSRLADDEVMRRCAEACRRCGTACRQLAGVEFPA
jgi:hypothetical protein